MAEQQAREAERASLGLIRVNLEQLRCVWGWGVGMVFFPCRMCLHVHAREREREREEAERR
jgi:hypothetical protein